MYSRTVFQQRHLTPQQVVLLLRGIVKGESSKSLAEELGLNYGTVLELRHDIQANAVLHQPETPLGDHVAETDEMFQNAGKKGEEHFDPDDPPRTRANKRKGRGTYENDRPPILGTVGRESGQVRLRVVRDTKKQTLYAHHHQFTHSDTIANTDEYQSYNGLQRERDTVCHRAREYARDDDGDGFCEVHCHTIEGLSVDVRNFLRALKDLNNRYLDGYLALCEFRRNLKWISPEFISALVRTHTFIHEPIKNYRRTRSSPLT